MDEKGEFVYPGVNSQKKNYHHHLPYHQKLTFGQKAADFVTVFGGSWRFITFFFVFIILWMALNSWMLTQQNFDPYPYILLNLILSCLAAVQAPIILMSQNRLAERDRVQARYDYQVNRKAEREIQQLHKEVKRTQQMIKAFGNRRN